MARYKVGLCKMCGRKFHYAATRDPNHTDRTVQRDQCNSCLQRAYVAEAFDAFLRRQAQLEQNFTPDELKLLVDADIQHLWGDKATITDEQRCVLDRRAALSREFPWWREDKGG